MYRLTYRDRFNNNNSTNEYFDDTKTLLDTLVGIVDDKKEEESAAKWLETAKIGSKVIRQNFGYKIECFSEDELKKNLQNIADEISKQSGVKNEFVGWDNDALTWDFNIGVSFMKFHDNYGLYLVINLLEPDGRVREVWNFTSKDKTQFIAYCTEALKQFNIADKNGKSNTLEIKDVRERERIDRWPNNSNKPKYDLERRAEEYANKFGIAHYRLNGFYMIYNQSYRTPKKVNGKVKVHQYSVQHKVDLRDYTEEHKILKRLDSKGFDNVH